MKTDKEDFINQLLNTSDYEAEDIVEFANEHLENLKSHEYNLDKFIIWIESGEKGLIISSYEDDIEKLIEMAKIYETIENLKGGFYTDMVTEIESQISHCKSCIKNLQKAKERQ